MLLPRRRKALDAKLKLLRAHEDSRSQETMKVPSVFLAQEQGSAFFGAEAVWGIAVVCTLHTHTHTRSRLRRCTRHVQYRSIPQR